MRAPHGGASPHSSMGGLSPMLLHHTSLLTNHVRRHLGSKGYLTRRAWVPAAHGVHAGTLLYLHVL